ncbi:MAG: 2-amino-4-hydroxy-6-hydroxymethyldihydropteridine diphosphokinase [Pseudomonadota bacterium]|nr:2-amino-4-hydroxy-6-hydroxymethyldihydropteridine diphosphokinase [Pseudomonadota bacterium]
MTHQPVMHRVYIGLGSNLDTPLEQLQQALQQLEQIPQTTLKAVSAFYGSTAVGPGAQPDYVNAAAEVNTQLAPHALLDHLQAIEQTQGRVRGPEQWSPRTLDLDLLLYGDECIATERLSVPHPRMAERNFVLQPLLDLNADLLLPDGRAVQALLSQLPSGGLWRL